MKCVRRWSLRIFAMDLNYLVCLTVILLQASRPINGVTTTESPEETPDNDTPFECLQMTCAFPFNDCQTESLDSTGNLAWNTCTPEEGEECLLSLHRTSETEGTFTADCSSECVNQTTLEKTDSFKYICCDYEMCNTNGTELFTSTMVTTALAGVSDQLTDEELTVATTLLGAGCFGATFLAVTCFMMKKSAMAAVAPGP